MNNFSSIINLKTAIDAGEGLSFSNRFLVTITPPSSLRYNNIRDMAILCQSCSIPGKQIETLEHLTVRNTTKIASGYSYEDVSMKFIATNNFDIKMMFDAWQNLAVDPVTYRKRYVRSYKSSVAIQQLDKMNKATFGVTLINAFPIYVNSVEFSAEADNQYNTVDVTFNFEDIQTYSAFSGDASIAANVSTSRLLIV